MSKAAFGVITMDGPAGVGKSTLARRLASELGVAYLDTGAMYRTLGLRLGAQAADMTDEELRARCRECRFTLEQREAGAAPVLCCNGEAVGDEIRTEKASRLASLVARLPVLREELQRAQREIGAQCSLVAEGRDMGTRVFPSARHKFFLDARPEVRAMRRWLELEARGTLNGETVEEIQAGIEARDHQDRNRAVDPLRPADDATIVDTSDLDLDGVLAVILAAVEKRQAEVPAEEEDETVRARAEFALPAMSVEEASLKLASACVAGMQAAKRILSLSDAEAVDLFVDFELTEDGHAAVVSEVADVEHGTAALCALVAVQTAAAVSVSGAEKPAEIRSFLI